MKKIICMAGLIVLGACSNDDKDERDINDITLNPQKISTPIAAQNPAGYSVWFAMANNEIFYMNPSNTTEAQFMLAYDMENNSFTEKTTNEEICACGYMSRPVSDGTFLYYAGNGGVKYSIEDNVWSEINYPQNVEAENNSTGVVYTDNKVYYAGGSNANNKFKYYDTASDKWFNATNLPYAVYSPDMVVINSKIYMLGGDEGDIKFSVYSESEGWIELEDLSFECSDSTYTPKAAAYKDRYIVYLNNNVVNIYDTKTGAWKESPIELKNIDSFNQALFSNEDNLYIAALSSGDQFSLYKFSF